MKKYYFTFGSWEKFPYQNTYLVVVSSNLKNAIDCFRERYPDVHPGCMNCSDHYSEDEWNRVGLAHYSDRRPAIVIWDETCFGEKPENYEDLFVFIPKKDQIIRIAKGNGDNLLPEDKHQGYVDCICYEQYNLDSNLPETERGQVLLKKMLKDQYQCMVDCIPDVLSTAYDDCMLDRMILA